MKRHPCSTGFTPNTALEDPHCILKGAKYINSFIEPYTNRFFKYIAENYIDDKNYAGAPNSSSVVKVVDNPPYQFAKHKDISPYLLKSSSSSPPLVVGMPKSAAARKRQRQRRKAKVAGVKSVVKRPLVMVMPPPKPKKRKNRKNRARNSTDGGNVRMVDEKNEFFQSTIVHNNERTFEIYPRNGLRREKVKDLIIQTGGGFQNLIGNDAFGSGFEWINFQNSFLFPVGSQRAKLYTSHKFRKLRFFIKSKAIKATAGTSAGSGVSGRIAIVTGYDPLQDGIFTTLQQVENYRNSVAAAPMDNPVHDVLAGNPLRGSPAKGYFLNDGLRYPTDQGTLPELFLGFLQVVAEGVPDVYCTKSFAELWVEYQVDLYDERQPSASSDLLFSFAHGSTGFSQTVPFGTTGLVTRAGSTFSMNPADYSGGGSVDPIDNWVLPYPGIWYTSFVAFGTTSANPAYTAQGSSITDLTLYNNNTVFATGTHATDKQVWTGFFSVSTASPGNVFNYITIDATSLPASLAWIDVLAVKIPDAIAMAIFSPLRKTLGVKEDVIAKVMAMIEAQNKKIDKLVTSFSDDEDEKALTLSPSFVSTIKNINEKLKSK